MKIETLNLIPFAVVWAVLALIVIYLILVRRKFAHQEDDTLRVLEGPVAISHQEIIAKKLDQIDRWGKVLTLIAVLYGIIIGVAFVYQNWVLSSNYMGQ
jgi:hypothetical protein